MRHRRRSSAEAEQLRAAWSALHGGYDADASVVLRAWLGVMQSAARALARRGVGPDAVTATGLALATGAVGVARHSPAMAAALVAGSVVLDGVDGAVAIATGRVTSRGALLDTVSDRVADVCFGVALAQAGALRRAAALAAVAPIGFESVRSLVTDNRRRGVGPITMGDRPTRVAIVLTALLAAGLDRRLAKTAATTGAALVVGACAAGAWQLLRANGSVR